MNINLNLYPPHVRAAVLAILRYEDEQVDEMGYDAEWYKYDLPRVVCKVLGNSAAEEFIREQM